MWRLRNINAWAFAKSFQAALSASDHVMRNNGLSNNESFLEKIISTINKQQTKEAFFVMDLVHVINLLDTWKPNLPMIQPFFAVKCNPHPDFLATLVAVRNRVHFGSQSFSGSHHLC
jgi:hypothetical protein